MKTDRQRIREHARAIAQNSTVGVVTKVYEHDDPDDRSNHEANVQLANQAEEFRRIPIHCTRNGHISVPQQGDFVEVDFNGSDRTRPYVAGYAYDDVERAPLGRAGHWRHVFGDTDNGDVLVLEAEPSDHSSGTPNTLRLAVKDDGLSDPSTAVEIDDSGSSPTATMWTEDGTDRVEISIDTSDNTIDIVTSGQQVRIGDRNGSFDPVARVGDTVEVDDPDSGTITGEITSGSDTVDVS